MATVLFAWELGGGLGHLGPLTPLVRRLCGAGHRVFAALKDLSRADAVFGEPRISYLQAPNRAAKADHPISPTRTFAHVLNNTGFGDVGALRTLTDAWRSLFDYVRPDLIIFDHSPTALLAARGLETRRATIGTGFCCPPGGGAFADLRGGHDREETERLRQDEERVLERANKVLERWHLAPLRRLSQLYGDVDETLLTTFKELDHYPDRENGKYWGVWPCPGGKAPQWPQGRGKKVYAYLKTFPARSSLLTLLNVLRCPTLVYLEGREPKSQRRFASATLRFENQRLDLTEVGRQCDLAILNAGHGATASLLLTGTPILQLPLYMEQELTGAATRRLGAGFSARARRPEEIAVKLMAMLNSDKYAQGARDFAARYADYDPEQQTNKVLQRIEELLG